MAVDDGVDLVGALRRLIDALRAVAPISGAIARARASVSAKPVVCAST
jgi:hypothetical protein